MDKFKKHMNIIIFALIAFLLVIIISVSSNGSTEISSAEIEKNSAVWNVLESENQRLESQLLINKKRQDNLERRNELLRELFMDGQIQ